MAGDGLQDPARALQYKERGNASFKRGDYLAAESYYTQAITLDRNNGILYTNRAFTFIKMSAWSSVIEDARTSIALMPQNMKGHYYLSQAQFALGDFADALHHAKIAHKLCIDDGSKGYADLSMMTELVLKCKKADWERREDERLKGRKGLLVELEDLLESAESKFSKGLNEEERKDLEKEYDGKIALLRSTFELARVNGEEDKRRTVPDWLIDGISFSVMVDPVITKSGKSYDRATVIEHLKNNPVDPLTREPMTIADLRPNIALKEACEQYLEENGWAVDY